MSADQPTDIDPGETWRPRGPEVVADRRRVIGSGDGRLKVERVQQRAARCTTVVKSTTTMAAVTGAGPLLTGEVSDAMQLYLDQDGCTLEVPEV